MKQLIAALLLTLGATAALAADVGDVLPAFELKTASDDKVVLGDAVQRIYATVDRKADEQLAEALKAPGQAALDARQAVVIADISKAPFFVKGIIKSSLEERSYVTWVDTRGKTRGHLPFRADQVTVLDIDKRKITAIRYLGSAEGLAAEFAPEE